MRHLIQCRQYRFDVVGLLRLRQQRRQFFQIIAIAFKRVILRQEYHGFVGQPLLFRFQFGVKRGNSLQIDVSLFL